MKKKGLIISTVVMVVVLIAALTTTTFAWFTTTANNKVEDISLSVESNNDVRFGVAKDNKVMQNPTDSSFLSDSITWSTKWDGGASTLGVRLDTGLTALKFGKAVYTGTDTAGNKIDTVDGSDAAGKDTNKTISDTNLAHGLFTADGDGITVGSSVTAATENVDYVHLVLGVRAARDDVKTKKLNCKVKIDVSGNTAEIGMNAAMYYVYRVYKQSEVTASAPKPLFKADAENGDKVKQGEFFTKSTYQTAAEGIDDGELTIAVEETGIANLTDIYQIDLYIFINGWDKDCVTNATGVTSKIQISFATAE